MSDINLLITRQVGRWVSERKESEAEGVSIEHPSHLKPIITVSRQQGCRGTTFAIILANELHYGLFDRKIIEFIADHMGVCSELVESLDETGRSALEQWVDNLLRQQVFDGDDYIRGLGEVIKTASLQGGVVLLGRGSNYMLKGTNAFHVRLIAPIETRVHNLMEFDGMDEKQARESIEKTDRDRKQYIKKYFHQDVDDPLAFDVVINMEKIALDPAVKIVLTCLRARGFSVEDTGGDKRKRD